MQLNNLPSINLKCHLISSLSYYGVISH